MNSHQVNKSTAALFLMLIGSLSHGCGDDDGDLLCESLLPSIAGIYRFVDSTTGDPLSIKGMITVKIKESEELLVQQKIDYETKQVLGFLASNEAFEALRDFENSDMPIVVNVKADGFLDANQEAELHVVRSESGCGGSFFGSSDEIEIALTAQ